MFSRFRAALAVTLLLPVAALALPDCHLASGLSDFEIGDGAGGTAGQGGAAGQGASAGGEGGSGANGGSGGQGGTSRHVWSQRFGDPDTQEGSAVDVDAAGNVYFGGSFKGQLVIGEPLNSAGDFDGFVAKLDPSGNPAWALGFGDAEEQRPSGLAVDASGNVYLVGRFRGTIDFGGGPHTANGEHSGFVVKYDSSGAHQWSHAYGISGSTTPQGVAVKQDGSEVAIIGGFIGDADFGNGVVSAVTFADVFLVRLDSDGNLVGSDVFGDAGTDYGQAVAYDGLGNLIVAGHYGGSLTLLDCPALEYHLLDYNIFLAKLSFEPAADCLWSRSFGDFNNDHVVGVSSDPSNGVLLSGYFYGDLDLGDGQVHQADPGATDAFVARFQHSGASSWSRSYGGLGNDSAGQVRADSSGNVFVTGYCFASIDVGQGQVPCGGGGDTFLVQHSTQGDVLWGEVFGNPGQAYGWGVSVDPQDHLLLGGAFTQTINLGGDDLDSSGDIDLFVAKFAP